MIKLFLTNIFVTNLLLIPYLVILRISSFINPPDHSDLIGMSPLLDWIYESVHPFILTCLSVLLIFFQSILINLLVNRNKLNNKNSLLAGFAYCLSMSLLPGFFYFHPILIANTFIILMLIEITHIYKSYKPIYSLFMSGFYLGISLLIIPHYILLLLFLIQVILLLRDVNFREFFQCVTGIVVPLFLAATFGLNNEKEGFLYFINSQFVRPDIQSLFHTKGLIVLGLGALLVLFSLTNVSNLRKKKSVKVQNILTMLYLMMLFTLPMLFFASANTIAHLLTLLLPISILYSMLLYVTKRIMVAEFIHLCTFAAIILAQFGIIF